MKTLKEKLQETIKQHKEEVNDNLKDKAIHIGNLKNIRSGDSIRVYYGNFYTVAKYAKINLIDRKREIIYIHLHGKILRFNMFNCEEWILDCKEPNEESTTAKKNWALADSTQYHNLIKYPIINVEYKEKLPISINHLCYDIESFNACPRLTWSVSGYYFCNYLQDLLFANISPRLNSKRCFTGNGG